MHFSIFLGLLLILIALVCVVYHKLSKAIQTLRTEAATSTSNVIRQIESLLAVYAEVRPGHALPKSRGWAASPDLLALLIASVQENKPQTVLECSSGLSTVVLASCMRNLGRGKVISLEHDAVYAQRTRRLLELHNLSDWAEVIDAPLVPQTLADWSGKWYDSAKLPEDCKADLLVIDGPPYNTGLLARYPAVPVLYQRLTPGALIVLDDANRDDERVAVERWIRQYPDLERVSAAECEKGCAVLKKRSRIMV